ncbi:MAG TPA: hypothetical protein VFT22_37950 [Kofleriaceae bacterium]|nr:hypothetical protein [Kofleriaceae bacterium]
MNARTSRSLAAAVVAVVAACRGTPADDAVCRCTPGNASRTKLADGTALDGQALLARLRRHRRDVEQHRTPRDIKVFDDELRFEISNFCQPCGDWVKDRMTIEDMFPLDRLDDATSSVCLGLVLRDGTTAYGDARPRACR